MVNNNNENIMQQSSELYSSDNVRSTRSDASSSSSSHRRTPHQSNSKELMKPLSLSEACADGSPPPPLVISDRVVWISDNGPEYGIVKWLGKLPDVGHDWMAGVDFDNAVGSGTGLYNDHQLFETKVNHASLVPVIGLMKATDFLGAGPPIESALRDTTHGIVPQKPRRVKQKQKDHAETKSDDSSLGITNSLANMTIVADNSQSEAVNSIVNSHKTVNSNVNNNFKVNRSTNLSITQLPLTMESSNMMVPRADQKNTIVEDVPWACMTNSNANTSLSTQMNGTSTYGFEVGSVIEVTVDSLPRYGVVRWIGTLHDPDKSEDNDDDGLMAGVEIEEECNGCTDGTWNGKRYFECAPKRGYFVKLNMCTKDSRFASASDRRRSLLFGSIDCPTVTGDVAPLSTSEDLQALCGKNRGIQGHHNSCYLDATLFAMFSCTTIFESLLHRPPRYDDIPEYCDVQRVLKEEIVNPLRANLYVRADRVMHLRTLLEKISSVRGLTSEEKDPEEFLNLLLNEILKAEPFLKLSSGLESFFYQLFVEKDEKLHLPTVQQLFDQSFLASDIKLREVPPCLLIQMPRFGRQFKMYPRIVPSLYLDITDVLENSPRQCAICGIVAEFECKECFGQFGEGLDSVAFCAKCMDKSHGHKKRSKHKTTKLKIPPEFTMLKEHSQIPRIYMELFAVLCIETSHYVSFVKCGSGPDSPWCFFDSMADRKGEQNGYNIPEIVSFPDLRWWLSDEGTSFLLSTKDDKVLPEMPRRLLCDAYICWYASDVLRYR